MTDEAARIGAEEEERDAEGGEEEEKRKRRRRGEEEEKEDVEANIPIAITVRYGLSCDTLILII